MQKHIVAIRLTTATAIFSSHFDAPRRPLGLPSSTEYRCADLKQIWRYVRDGVAQFWNVRVVRLAVAVALRRSNSSHTKARRPKGLEKRMHWRQLGAKTDWHVECQIGLHVGDASRSKGRCLFRANLLARGASNAKWRGG